jgi:hypothetical protein
MGSGPNYDKALAALQAAHDACFKDCSRPVNGMSHGPFSGVNVALGIICLLEEENIALKKENIKLCDAATRATATESDR